MFLLFLKCCQNIAAVMPSRDKENGDAYLAISICTKVWRTSRADLALEKYRNLRKNNMRTASIQNKNIRLSRLLG